MKLFHSYIILTFLFLVVILGCEEQFDLTQLPDAKQVVVIGDTTYIEISPPWGGFLDPRSILIGHDQLIYVGDYANNEIVMMNAAGVVLHRRTIPHPTAIGQNNKLDLYVTGETLSPNGDTIGAVYKINLVRFDTTYFSHYDTIIVGGDTTIRSNYRDTSFYYNHNLSIAPIRIVWQEPAHPRRRFTGIAVFADNEYLLTRVGTEYSFVDPDSRVLLFNKEDVFVNVVGDLATRPTGGSTLTDINQITGITAFPNSRDFILTQSLEGVRYGALWMIYRNQPDFQGWLPKFDLTDPLQRGTDFVTQGLRKPVAVAIDRRRRDIFVVDAELDSVIKFDRNGKFKRESFGKVKSESATLPGLDNPTGVAFSNDCLLYIVDNGHKLIRRFRLSTQTLCN
jgi:hypothetical protein